MNPGYQVAGPNPRTHQNLPSGYWYPNVDFDSSWFGANYALIDFANSKVILYAKSNYDLLWGGRGWSNSFVHQGSPPYSGGVYEGRFKAGSNPNNAIAVDGIKYDVSTAEPEGKHYIHIKARLLIDNLNYWFSNNGLLISFIFQYEFYDGTLSEYDAPPFTNHYQSCHFDVFIHRTFKLANIPGSFPSDSWYHTLGDAYNGDLHVHYVYNGKMEVGQWYDFYIDFGKIMNTFKNNVLTECIGYNLPLPKYLILKYIQISAETIGGEILAEIDVCEFITL